MTHLTQLKIYISHFVRVTRRSDSRLKTEACQTLSSRKRQYCSVPENGANSEIPCESLHCCVVLLLVSLAHICTSTRAVVVTAKGAAFCTGALMHLLELFPLPTLVGFGVCQVGSVL